MADDRYVRSSEPVASWAGGTSLLLSGAALWLSHWGFRMVTATYDRFAARTDLDIRDWSAINLDLTLRLLPVIGIAAVCELVAAVLFPTWAARAGWLARIGFASQWFGSAVLIGLLVWSRIP
jgi:hypothetical protein